MMGVLYGVWAYRGEIALALGLLTKLRKTAQELTREYIRRRVTTGLRRALLTVALQLAILTSAWLLDHQLELLATRLLASACLWAMTLYNLFVFAFSTLPELRAVQRTLRSKTGYAVKYVLQISLVTELMQWNVILLFLCLCVGVSSRLLVGASFSYLAPWLELWSRL